MYHAHFKGTHYEAGFRWGSLLLKHQNIILDKIPFEITKERIEYALSCIPIYEKFYPEILDEIQGLADGQHCDVHVLQAVLFSMYSMPPTCNCSCFASVTKEGILLGRNSDFLTAIEKLNQNVIYRLTDGAYSFTGNTTAFIEIEDGINEYGLAIGLTSVYPFRKQPGFNAGLLLRYLLEKCKNVSEAIFLLNSLPIASAQTLTLADLTGDIAVVESNSVKIKIVRPEGREPSFVCATNIFHHPEMQIYNNQEIDNWFAETRYKTLVSALSRKNNISGLMFAEKLLAGKYGFLCQYDRNTGKDTVWSVVYDLKEHKIYRTEGNPGRKKFKEDLRFKF
ncbi:MAG: linear amide C-N hydrolase [Clostridiales bacterium]|nr:linear amide C-N hydrolase [Clostridiales bacterium]